RDRGPRRHALASLGGYNEDYSSSLVPSPSPEPFSGTGGHHVCGAACPSALAGTEMPSGGQLCKTSHPWTVSSRAPAALARRMTMPEDLATNAPSEVQPGATAGATP